MIRVNRFNSKLLRQKQGMALLSVMLFFIVMIIMIGGLTILTHGNLRNSKVPTYSSAAYFAADAGVNYAMSKIEDLQASVQDDVDNNIIVTISDFEQRLEMMASELNNYYMDLSDNSGRTTSTLVNVTRLEDTNEGFPVYEVTATGTVGTTQRSLRKVLYFGYTGEGDDDAFTVKHAILTTRNMTLDRTNVQCKYQPRFLDEYGITLSDWNSLSLPNNLANLTQAHLLKWCATIGLAFDLDDEGELFQRSVTLQGSTALGQIEILDTPLITTNFSSQSQIVGDPDVTNDIEYLEYPDIVIPTNITELTNAELASLPESNASNYLALTGTRSYTIPPVPSDKKGYYASELVLGDTASSTWVTINVNQNTTIVVDRLNIVGQFRVQGEGRLIIYVRGNPINQPASSLANIAFKLPSNSSIAPGAVLGHASTTSPDQLLFYVDDIYYLNNGVPTPATVTLENNVKFRASLFANNLSLQLSNNSGFIGYIVTGGSSVSISNNATIDTTLYYAPNAHFHLNNGANVSGAIIARSFSSVQATVIYDPIVFSSFPFQIFEPVSGMENPGITSTRFIIGPTIEY